MTLYLTEAQVGEILTMDLALDMVEEVFDARGRGEVINHPRTRIALGRGSYNLMSAGWPEKGVVGSKSYVGGAGGISFQVLIYGASGEGLLGILDANLMGQIRTGAASGVATKHMARWCENSKVAVIGSGYQARTQLEAVAGVREIETASVYSRTAENRDGFATSMTEKLEIPVTATTSVDECLEGADIIIVITNTREPVLLGDSVQSGVHINAAGANGWQRRELDTRAVVKCDVIATDDIDQAKTECADLMAAADSGRIRWEQVINLGDIIAGNNPGRTDASQVTLFESQGVAMEDIAVGKRVLDMALERGIGTELSGGGMEPGSL
ncbi:MAG TPA: ornithine cyclodeaminase family protein [Dehalococcoidia bacterium]|jgi:ornithine cyclodeaminase/alanine dehydrogenase-like protein (mu-crystallin family)|nr:ornithine cyclodeaminase [Chloroflexota bacterium]MDP5876237.1 ornithine cyclodeaminase family protein [Dehalococcoidia bacterium]MDP6272634.1 ornithine cyclodeaminase family protein [Dehalococcoidia bacterium]MDP7161410.1 ornithine cyclodeaminase family protein [Dehalococcoidia bacterium]MDP7212663.1 ornithine cyclodeaminase family protein [Dehalococcoidia bacterium]|tara:strand:+ start:253 stop:1233 length:981 start_codon:yes stop_codon:yes gene_type:complete